MHEGELLKSPERVSAVRVRVMTGGIARAALAIGILLASLLVLWPTTLSLMERWEDNVQRAYTHGYAILAITFWLLWRGRDRWGHQKLAAVPAAAAVLVLQGLVWVIAYRASLQIVHQTLLPVMVLTALVTCMGVQIARGMTLPVLYLYFAIPVWGAINPLLQWTSVIAVRAMLRMADIPAFFVGNNIQIPAGIFEIAGGCSGLHFFIVACAIAVLHGEINRDTWKLRWRLVMLACVLALITNWVRVFIIVVVGHVTNMRHYLVAEEHYSFGWFMFVGTMTVYFLIARRWPAGPVAEKLRPEHADSTAIARPAVALMLVALSAVPVWSYLKSAGSMPDSLADPLPADSRRWSRSAVSPNDWLPVFVGADREVNALFSSDSAQVQGYSAVYARQHQGKELIGYGNSALGPALTRQRDRQASPAPWSASHVVDARGDHWLLWHAYRVDDAWHSRALPLQLNYAVRSLFGSPLASIVVLRSRCEGEDCTGAKKALEDFAASSWRTGGEG